MSKITTWCQLFLDGVNQPRDYPAEDARQAFTLDAASAQEVIDGFKSHGAPLPVDYQHGMWQPIPGVGFPDRLERAGKMVDMKYVPGDGLYTLIPFTERASALITHSEGAYLSAVTHIDPKTRKPKYVFGAALTPTPAINLKEIQAFSAQVSALGAEIVHSNPFKITLVNSTTEPTSTAGDPPAGAKHMSEHLKKIAVLLKAENETDPEKLAEKAVGLIDTLSSIRDESAAVVGLDPKVATLSEIGNAIKERLKAATPDMSKFVSATVHAEALSARDGLAAKVADLETKIATYEAEKIIAALTVGNKVKITPALKPLALSILLRDRKEFDAFVEALPVQVVTGGGLSNGGIPAPDKKTNSDALETARLAAQQNPEIKLIEQPAQGR